MMNTGRIQRKLKADKQFSMPVSLGLAKTRSEGNYKATTHRGAFLSEGYGAMAEIHLLASISEVCYVVSTNGVQ